MVISKKVQNVTKCTYSNYIAPLKYHVSLNTIPLKNLVYKGFNVKPLLSMHIHVVSFKYAL